MCEDGWTVSCSDWWHSAAVGVLGGGRRLRVRQCSRTVICNLGWMYEMSCETELSKIMLWICSTVVECPVTRISC